MPPINVAAQLMPNFSNICVVNSGNEAPVAERMIKWPATADAA